ncbi:MAG: DUF3501 family protein [Bdellovibrionales bacterium]|nr:DUF3501 family protein [Bdellovibrionales bacterium]
MAKKVNREEVLDYQTYSDTREELRAPAQVAKSVRRIHLGPHLTFLFENHLTTLYQIQEMMRVERIVKEADIQHEIDTYNGLLADPGNLSCTLLIEIPEPEVRDQLLRDWLGLEKHLYVKTRSGERGMAQFDAGQVGSDRLSSVQYLKFSLQGHDPVAIGCDFPLYRHEQELTEEQRQALQQDMQE